MAEILVFTVPAILILSAILWMHSRGPEVVVSSQFAGSNALRPFDQFTVMLSNYSDRDKLDSIDVDIEVTPPGAVFRVYQRSGPDVVVFAGSASSGDAPNRVALRVGTLGGPIRPGRRVALDVVAPNEDRPSVETVTFKVSVPKAKILNQQVDVVSDDDAAGIGPLPATFQWLKRTRHQVVRTVRRSDGTGHRQDLGGVRWPDWVTAMLGLVLVFTVLTFGQWLASRFAGILDPAIASPTGSPEWPGAHAPRWYTLAATVIATAAYHKARVASARTHVFVTDGALRRREIEIAGRRHGNQTPVSGSGADLTSQP